MPVYKYVCTHDRSHAPQLVHRPVDARNDPVEKCHECGSEMERTLEAPFRSPRAWYSGPR